MHEVSSCVLWAGCAASIQITQTGLPFDSPSRGAVNFRDVIRIGFISMIAGSIVLAAEDYIKKRK